jgi:ferredoxin
VEFKENFRCFLLFSTRGTDNAVTRDRIPLPHLGSICRLGCLSAKREEEGSALPDPWSSSIMPTVTVEGEKSFEVEPGRKLVLAIEDAGIDIMHRCGGNARCTTCRVQVMAGEPAPMQELERERLARELGVGPDVRLSCQIRVDGDLWVQVINRAAAAGISAGPRPED